MKLLKPFEIRLASKNGHKKITWLHACKVAILELEELVTLIVFLGYV